MANDRALALRNFKTGLDQRAPEFARALPPQIPPARFTRVALTAVQNNPDLLDCSPQSVFNSCMKAAQDGLLPDGREGAIVKYGTEAQWMPMVAGIRKKARNSGEIASIIACVVLKGEDYRYWIDEEGEHIRYEPGDDQIDIKNLDEAREKVRLVFAMAKLKDGTLVVQPMSVDQVARVQLLSKAKKEDSPWKQWWGEMAKKTAIRRLSKSLPMSSDLDDLVRRDDELYDVDNKQLAPPTVLDLDALPANGAETPPPPQSNTPAAGSSGGADASGADGSETRDGASSPDKSPSGEREPTELEQSIAGHLLDCKTDKDCDGVRDLFRLEIEAADQTAQLAIALLIKSRKAVIAEAGEKASADDFPGDRKQ